MRESAIQVKDFRKIYGDLVAVDGNFFLRSFATNELYIPEHGYRLVVYSIVLIIILILNKNKLNPKNIQIENNFK